MKSLGLEDVWPKPKRRRSKRKKQDETSNARKRHNVFSTEVEAFESMAALRPELAPLAEAVKIKWIKYLSGKNSLIAV